MNDLVEFLTSQEILFVYLISALACILCLIVYLVQKKSEIFRRRQNTKELNKLVEEVRERVPDVEESVVNNEPVIQSVEEVKEVVEILEEATSDIPEIKEEEEQLEYTTIEPDQETAKLELQKLKEELEIQEEKARQEQLKEQEELLRRQELERQMEQARLEEIRIEEEKVKEETINIDEYEDNQEATAIISIDELMEKSRELYNLNELSQYASDMDQPISIQDLEKQMSKTVTKYDEPFIIENVVVDDGSEDLLEEVEATPVEVQPVVDVQPTVVHEEKKFKSSPIISPIFGIEKNPSEDNSLSLENTANYEKLDQQLQKSNEFYMSLKEFQKNL